MALAPWNVLGQGKIRSNAEEQRRLESGEGGRALHNPEWLRTETERKVCDALEKVAADVGAKNITSGTLLSFLTSTSLLTKLFDAVAIAWTMQRVPYVFPIIGGRKVEHLQANLEALDIALTPEQIKFLDDVVPFDKGFPYSFFVRFLRPLIVLCRYLTFVDSRAMGQSTMTFTRRLDILRCGLNARLFVRLLIEGMRPSGNSVVYF